LSACRIPERFFSLRYLWFNFRVYFLEPANWSARFPFVNEITPPPSPPGHLGVERGFGILPNIPLACFAMAVPFVWRRWSSEADKSLRWFITAVALLVGICALTLGVFCAAYLRYEMDFLPALMLLAVVGILGLERALADQPVRRQAVRWGWCILGGFSVAFNLLQCFLQLANTHNTLGIALREVGRAPEAIIEYEQAVRIKPDYVEAQYNLGLTLLEGGRAPEALEHFQQAIRIKPDFADAHLNLGVALEQLGRNADAIPQFEQALRIRPDFAVAQNNLGNALLQSGRIPEAIEHLTQALRIKPDYVEAHYNLGNALYQMGRVPEAIGHYQEALRIRPDYAKAHCNLGLALGQTGRLREAIDQYEQALRINPGYAEAHYNLGNALLRTGKLQDAIGHFEQALRLVPKYAQAHNSLGLALSGTGRVQDAIGHYEQALRIKPDFAEAHSNLGVVLERVGKLQDAVGHYEEAVRIKPDYAPAQNSLAWILATNDDDRLRNPAKAVQLAERACDLTARRDPNFLDTLAAAYAANGRFADAIRTAEQAANLALAAGQKDLAGQIQHRLELYKAGRPYYEKPVASEPAK
jgi:tetratricopeptide (TPR) repeat protein